MYGGLDHGPMNIWCEFGKDHLKTEGHRAHATNLDPSGQKWNCRAPKIDWHLGFGLRNRMYGVNFEKNQLKPLWFTMHKRNKQISPPDGSKWNHRVRKINWRLDLGPMHIWSEYEENQLKTLVSRVHTTKMHLAP